MSLSIQSFFCAAYSVQVFWRTHFEFILPNPTMLCSCGFEDIHTWQDATRGGNGNSDCYLLCVTYQLAHMNCRKIHLCLIHVDEEIRLQWGATAIVCISFMKLAASSSTSLGFSNQRAAKNWALIDFPVNANEIDDASNTTMSMLTGIPLENEAKHHVLNWRKLQRWTNMLQRTSSSSFVHFAMSNRDTIFNAAAWFNESLPVSMTWQTAAMSPSFLRAMYYCTWIVPNFPLGWMHLGIWVDCRCW